MKGVLAIRRIFSKVDMIQNLNFQIALIFLKLDCFGSKICIESIEIGFKATHHLQKVSNGAKIRNEGAHLCDLAVCVCRLCTNLA